MTENLPVMQFERPSDQIVETPDGYASVRSLGWIKFSAQFRKNMLKELKGAKLSVFMCICLHLNENGTSFPGIETIAEETGYHRDTVMEAIEEMESIPNLLKVLRARGKSNKYKPYFAARGANKTPIEPVGKIRLVGNQPVDVFPTPFDQTSRPFPDSKESKELILSEEEIKQANQKVDAILGFQHQAEEEKQNGKSWRLRDNFQFNENVLKLADLAVSRFGEPSKKELTVWVLEIGSWVDAGARAEDWKRAVEIVNGYSQPVISITGMTKAVKFATQERKQGVPAVKEEFHPEWVPFVPRDESECVPIPEHLKKRIRR